MTQFAREQWYKIAAILMQKMEASHKHPALPDYEVEITPGEIDRISQRDMAIVIQEREQRLFIRLMPRAKAEELARKEGGMPA